MRSRSWLLLATALLLTVATTIFWLGRTRSIGQGVGPSAPAETKASASSAAPVPATRRAPIALIPARPSEPSPSLPAGAFTGRVLSSQSGAPVPGAELTFEESGVAHSVRADPRGRVPLRSPAARPLPARGGERSGFPSLRARVGARGDRAQARAGAEVSGLAFYLSPNVARSGLVEGPDGKPKAGATVTALEPSELRAERWTTDANGEFSFRAPEGALLEARAQGLAGRARVSGGSVRIRLAAAPASAERLAISARVVGPDGVPAEGALVEATPDRSLEERFEETTRASSRAVADGEGNVRLDGLDPGAYRVRATAPGFAPAEQRGVQAGATGVQLTLGRGATVHGQVRAAADGAPVTAFTVDLETKTSSLAREAFTTVAVVDAEGRFELAGVPAGSYALMIAAHGFALSSPQTVQVASPPADPPALSISLERGGRVWGRVVDEKTGAAIADARIELEGGISEAGAPFPVSAATSSDREGRFELSGLAEGLRSVTVTAAGHHGRILSGLEVQNDGSIGPVEVALAPTEKGEEPRLELVGIGAVLTPKDDVLVIGRLIPQGGGAEAGLQPGDEVVTIEGQPVKDLGFEQCVNLIRGPENSVVRLGIPPARRTRACETPRCRAAGCGAEARRVDVSMLAGAVALGADGGGGRGRRDLRAPTRRRPLDPAVRQLGAEPGGDQREREQRPSPGARSVEERLLVEVEAVGDQPEVRDRPRVEEREPAAAWAGDRDGDQGRDAEALERLSDREEVAAAEHGGERGRDDEQEREDRRHRQARKRAERPEQPLVAPEQRERAAEHQRVDPAMERHRDRSFQYGRRKYCAIRSSGTSRMSASAVRRPFRRPRSTSSPGQSR